MSKQIGTKKKKKKKRTSKSSDHKMFASLLKVKLLLRKEFTRKLNSFLVEWSPFEKRNQHLLTKNALPLKSTILAYLNVYTHRHRLSLALIMLILNLISLLDAILNEM